MTTRKEQELKDFLISERRKIGPGFTTAPVWAMQRKGDRIWNSKQKRTWKQVGLGKLYRRRKKRIKKKK